MANTLVVNEILIFQNQNHNIIKNHACMFVEKWMKKNQLNLYSTTKYDNICLYKCDLFLWKRYSKTIHGICMLH